MIATFTTRIEASECLRAVLTAGRVARMVTNPDGTYSVVCAD